MTTPIEPALRAEEWAAEEIPSAYVTHDGFTRGDLSRNGYALPTVHPVRLETSETTWEARDIPKLIALANDALPDSDDRKITRDRIALLRFVLSKWDGCGQDPLALQAWINDDTGTLQEPAYEYLGDRPEFDALPAFLDALASYLRPEGT